MINIFKKKIISTNKKEIYQDPPKEVPHRFSILDNQFNQQKTGWLQRLKNKLIHHRINFQALLDTQKINDDLYEKLAETLILADVGLPTTEDIIKQLKNLVKTNKLRNELDVRNALIEIITKLLNPLEGLLKIDEIKPTVIMLVGVNGAGKTTTIGKLAAYFKRHKKTVLLAAGDTFRAAAQEQLIGWGHKNQVPVITKENCDPASVIFEAIQQAKLLHIDIVLADTAGRLNTQKNLMNELTKIQKVITKTQPGIHHQTLLVVDGNNGQNTISQIIAFQKSLNITGLIVTKLDGTAKGGILAAIAHVKPIPVYFLGLGEQLEDLQPFNAMCFAQALIEPLEPSDHINYTSESK